MTDEELQPIHERAVAMLAPLGSPVTNMAALSIAASLLTTMPESAGEDWAVPLGIAGDTICQLLKMLPAPPLPSEPVAPWVRIDSTEGEAQLHLNCWNCGHYERLDAEDEGSVDRAADYLAEHEMCKPSKTETPLSVWLSRPKVAS